MRTILSVMFWAYLVISSIVLWSWAVVIWLVTLPFDKNLKALHWFSSWWGYHYVWLWPWWWVTYEGRDKLPKGPAVLAANHQSMADILVLYGLIHPFKWVSKAEIFKVPIIGWNMRMNDYVRLERGRATSAKKMMKACLEHLARGASIMIFPEGTRTRDGELRPFKHGAFTMAIDAKVPVVPILVEGTYTILPPTGWVLTQGMTRPTVRVLDPIPYDATGGDVAALCELTRERIREAQAQVRGVPFEPKADDASATG
jgi:1-acyl-sn-glycerol-3-phosphate acyltransferase